MSKSASLCVIGSANVDLRIRTARLPTPGETVGQGVFSSGYGGKGANTALAAARAGGNVTLVACVGPDAAADNMLASLAADNIDLTRIIRDKVLNTGTAFILVDSQGQNCIAVAPGANARLNEKQVAKLDRAFFRRSAMILLQCEIEPPAVLAALLSASKAGTPTLLNLAPAQPLPRAAFRLVDLLVVNAAEATFLTGQRLTHDRAVKSAAGMLRQRGVRRVVITLGARGCGLLDEDGYNRIGAPVVTAVDSTAAGDIFCGTLAVALAEGRTFRDAARFATAASALSVTRPGAQTSAPYRLEIERFLRRQIHQM